MLGIGGVTRSATAAATRGSRRGGFIVGHAASQVAPGPERIAAAAPLGFGLLGLQELGEDAARDFVAMRRAASLLEELQGLQADLLRGGANPARLARLAMLGDGEDGADPGLRDAVQAIGLRARIELIRHGREASVSSP